MTEVMKMVTLEFWTCVQKNPRQRNTERHANKIEKDLQVFLPQHAMVFAAQLPDGTLVKLDGHSRCLLWEQSRIPLPRELTMVIYPAMDMDHAQRMYNVYDNPLGTKSKADTVAGAFSEHGIQPESKLFQRCTLTYALTVAERVRTKEVSNWGAAIDINKAVLEWRDEIIKFDRIVKGHSGKRLPSGILAAGFITIRQLGFPAVAPFWYQYLDKKGSGGIHDAHNALLAFLTRCQDGKRTTGFTNVMSITEKALSACEAGVAGRPVKKLIGRDAKSYLSPMGGRRSPARVPVSRSQSEVLGLGDDQTRMGL